MSIRLQPVHYAAWEIFCMRLLFGQLLWWRLPGQLPRATPFPNGIATLLDLHPVADSFATLRVLFAVMLGFYVCGRLLWMALPYLLFLNVTACTLINSQGWIGHTDQIVS